MSGLYGQIADIIANVGEIDRSTISGDKHIFTDLLIDSLAFLDIVFDIDKATGVKLPVEDWLTAGDNDDAYSNSQFTVAAIVAYVEARQGSVAAA